MNIFIESSILLKENVYGKTIISVDIQPEYENAIYFLEDWITFLNENSENNLIVFLYNGANTLGMISEDDYKYWLFDNGLEEDVIYNAKFYDKGYAFFRNCIDKGIDEEQIVKLVQYMMKNNIDDSRDLEEHDWNNFIKQNSNVKNIQDYLQFNDDMINIPDLMNYLKNFENIVVMGGGVDECLREVEIALDVLKKPYETFTRFIY